MTAPLPVPGTVPPTVPLEARGLEKGFGSGPGRIPVLRNLDLTVRRGEMVAITGRSGVGKTTLLHVLGALDRPDRGRCGSSARRWRGSANGRRRPSATGMWVSCSSTTGCSPS